MGEELLPDLKARLRLDITALQASLAQAERAVSEVGRKSESAGGSGAFKHLVTGLTHVQEKADSTMRTLLRVAEVTGGLAGEGVLSKLTAGLGFANLPVLGAVTGALAGVFDGLDRLVVKTAEHSVEILRNSALLGINTNELQTLNLVAQQVGLGQQVMQKGLLHFQQEIATGAPNIKALGYSMERLGITSHDTGEAVYQAAGALERFKDPVERNAVGMALFGRRAAGMIEILKEGPAVLKQYEAEMAQFGLILDQGQLKTGALAARIHADFELSLQGLKQTVGADLEGAFTQLWGSILHAFGPDTKSAIDNIAKAIANVVGWVVSFIQGLFGLQQMMGDAASVTDTARGRFDELGQSAGDSGDALAKLPAKSNAAKAALDALRESTRVATQSLDDQIAVLRDHDTAIAEQVKMSALLQQHQDEQHQSYLSNLQDELAALNQTSNSQRSGGESLVSYRQKLHKQELESAIKKEEDSRKEHKTSTEIMMLNLKTETDAHVKALEDRKKALDRHLQSVEAAQQQADNAEKAAAESTNNAITASGNRMAAGGKLSFVSLSQSAFEWGEKIKKVFQGVFDFIKLLFSDPGKALSTAMNSLGQVMGSALVKGLVDATIGSLSQTEVGKFLYKHLFHEEATDALKRMGYDVSSSGKVTGRTPGTETDRQIAQRQAQADHRADYWGRVPGQPDANVPMPGHAYTGPTRANLRYLVGEKGPEMWSEDRPGHMTSNDDLQAMMNGGGGSTTYNTTFNGPVADEYVARIVTDRIAFEMRRRKMLDPIA